MTKTMLQLERLFKSEQLKLVFKLGQQSILPSRRYCCGIKPQTAILFTPNVQTRLFLAKENSFHTNFDSRRMNKDVVDEFDEKKSLMYHKEFEAWAEKDKKSFLETVRIYEKNARNRAGHVDFIKAALKKMKEFGVHRDLESYKKIIDVLPKGVYVCTNKYLVDGMYYPRQQYVALDLLSQMENNGVTPDRELGTILTNIFGASAHPTQRYMNFYYWAHKLKNRSPFIFPRPVPSDPLVLAKLAIERITSVDVQTQVSVYETSSVQNSVDKTWIVSGQSPKQKKLLAKHPKKVPVIVEGGDLVYFLEKSISYFVLKADGEPLPYIHPGDLDDVSNLESKYFNSNYVPKEETTVHEQDDGIIYGVCATGTSSRDSLLSWVRILQNTGNPILSDVPILFRFKQPEKLPSVTSEELVRQENKES